eukprot:CAMPEP_0197696232 /NCGR_PEP_ID=MMETSP1338-20131121/116363_1 /TAXON_ID=43686 ORGANISM="Pelagodinium beii, Strain RCC1491" /NCGR_SAMPLE_ID=MMETSP1338 /ASSEMBLY_ACC=CAM_ASM_000754 /LENGTH=134 /DNA_ID=CAMNT_0043279319 /DNA_START=1 /DNA_END=402 /DNA_ORIENTATION=-
MRHVVAIKAMAIKHAEQYRICTCQDEEFVLVWLIWFVATMTQNSHLVLHPAQLSIEIHAFLRKVWDKHVFIFGCGAPDGDDSSRSLELLRWMSSHLDRSGCLWVINHIGDHSLRHVHRQSSTPYSTGFPPNRHL